MSRAQMKAAMEASVKEENHRVQVKVKAERQASRDAVSDEEITMGKDDDCVRPRNTTTLGLVG